MSNELIGKTVGRYVLRELIGAGGMASVFRAEVVGDGREVAVKVLPFHLAGKETMRQRFLREARMASKLSHPHILPIYDFGEDGGAPYIVMELVGGGTLDDRISQRREKGGFLPLMFVVRTLAQVGAALDYAHAQGVIHRDIKPDNILFSAEGHVYLADFGIARVDEQTLSLTGTGGFIGTAAYASPEQCRGEDITNKSDIYALGVVLYEMLTGELPYQGGSPLAIMHKHISEPVPNPLRYRADLPVGINDVMRKALAKLPEVRYSSATALSQSLSTVLRRQLGTKPLLENAPPVGPDPVFDKPATAYTQPPPMPDDLLPELSPSRGAPPAGRDARIQRLNGAPAFPEDTQSARPTAPQPPGELSERQSASDKKPTQDDTGLFLILLVLAVLAVLVLIVLLAG